jgi:radical S-adenosyl methionine domain-containing protein 2
MTTQKFKSVSWAILEPCNMACKFCFATFNDIKANENLNAMSYLDGCKLLDEIQAFGITKITFYGGEPTLVKHLGLWIDYAKNIGLTTMLVTNGTLITEQYITQKLQNLDWIVLSIDSLNEETNMKIGRSTRQGVIISEQYYALVELFKKHKKRLKINTVVCSKNKDEDMSDFIFWAKPERWKILQTYRVKGQNDHFIDEMEITKDEFNLFVETNTKNLPVGVEIVPENTEDLELSYLMIDPKGRLFQSQTGQSYSYSQEILKIGLNEAYNQIQKNTETYINRKGLYEWN